ncbi:hypothetical protein N431DRAFT_397291 [Stipitochalara longipes BDJ]|nr:hypothetical protein N431DRAFT_397291 [Stipitochalara longipes BDJ]
MDKLNRLQALTGEADICEEQSAFQPFMFPTPKPQHLYEGTDSDDDEIIINRGRIILGNPSGDFNPSAIQSGLGSPTQAFPDFELQTGELAGDGESFCPFQSVKKYPYAYIGNANRQRVAAGFFDQGKVFDRTWDFFYLYRASLDTNQQPLLLVPTKQFEHFLEIINRSLKTNLTIPAGGANGAFQVTFENDGTPQPRYLGRSTNREMADNLKDNVPPRYYRPGGLPPSPKEPSDRSLAAFQAKINLMVQAQKGKKVANKEKQKKERIEKQHSWSHGIKRVQRYLGLRELRQGHLEAIRASLESSGLEWADYDAAVKAAAAKLPPTTSFHPGQLIRFEQEASVVFVCVDVEAYERNTKLVTEVGIATLDTQDLTSVVPGEGGANWMSCIRARHFRINEHKHLNNVEFVAGCADKFEFGASEFINLKDAPHIIASCFKHPFSKPEETAFSHEDQPKRNIVLVGHDIGADINFLQTIGYNVHNLSNLLETADTAFMWRYLKREANPRNLGSILAELGIIGWNLHNAGNDAVYTLQAMVAIAIKHIDEKNKAKEVREQEKKARMAEALREATEYAIEKEEGWSSEGSDGGGPVAPIPYSTLKGKKATDSRPRGTYSEGPWRPEERRGQIGGQRQLWEDPDKSKRPPKFTSSGKAAPFTDTPTSLEGYVKKTTLSDDKWTKNGGQRAKTN